jgi:hypothetical protein
LAYIDENLETLCQKRVLLEKAGGGRRGGLKEKADPFIRRDHRPEWKV